MTTAQSKILGDAAIRGGATTLGGQAIKLVLHLVGLVVLARLLGPAEFGLVAMVTAIIGVGDILRDMGLSSAAIQAKHINHQQKSNLFWMNAGLGLSLSVACASLSGILSQFYDEPRLGPIALALSITFLVNGLQTQFQAELARQFRFMALSLTEILAMFSGLLTAILLSIAGAAYWALVGQLIVQSIMLALARMTVARWRPTWPRRHPGMAPLLRYGRNLMLTQILVYVSSNIDSVLVGSKFGSASLGLYNRAFQLLTLPLNQIFTPLTNVALPTLSRLQDDVERFQRHVERAQVVLGYGVVLMFAAAFALAEPMIEIVFGSQWSGSAPIFRILAVAGAFQAISYVSYWVFLARALTGSHFRYSLVSRSILIGLILLGSSWGINGVAVGYTSGIIIGWIAALLWLRGFHEVPVLKLFVNGLRVVFVGVLVSLVGYVSLSYFSGLQVGQGIALSILSMIGVFLFLTIIPPIRRDVKVVVATSKRITARSAK